jgi:hypothetical protein
LQLAHLVGDLPDARHPFVVRLRDLDGYRIPPLVNDEALHGRLQRLRDNANSGRTHWVLVLAAAVTATLPRGDRGRHLPAAQCAVDQTDERVDTGPAEVLASPARVVQQPDQPIGGARHGR